MPTLILWGAQDKLIPVGQADAWAKFIPGAKVRVLQNCGHLVLAEKPEAVKEITDFLT
jgi:pimeloyl-ACP methyl ester carboxylesterase